MMNRFFLQRLPFTDVYIHAMIQDGHGQKMSKSLGNGVDPRDIIRSHGADAMRFTLAQLATSTQDVRMPVDMVCPHSGEVFEPDTIRNDQGYLVAAPIQRSPSDAQKSMVSSYGHATGEAQLSDEMPLAQNTSSRFDVGRNFCNKLWNAMRFAISNLQEEAGEDDGEPALIDRWIISRLGSCQAALEEAMAGYQFSAYAEQIYGLVWKDFCDWYLEGIKPTIRTSRRQQATLHAVLDSVIRMLHPLCPFVTETLWPHLQRVDGRGGIAGISLPPSELCATAAWPVIDGACLDTEAVERFQEIQGLVLAIRNLRGERQVKSSRRIGLHVPAELLQMIRQGGGVVETMAGIGVLGRDDQRPADAIAIPFGNGQIFVSDLVDTIDKASERQRLEKVLEKARGRVQGLSKRLANPAYVEKAKPELVQETRDMLVEAERDLAVAEEALRSLD